MFKDRALALPPLNSTLARRMMEQTKIFTALKGVRGRKPVDLPALEQLLVRFSQLVVEQPWIKEIDINPLLASPERLLALDARVVVHGPGRCRRRSCPKPAIRPYPIAVRERMDAEGRHRGHDPADSSGRRAADGRVPRDALASARVYMRYFQPLKLGQRIAHERLTRICFIDYDREMALVVERKTPDGESRDHLGIAA